MNAKDRKMNGVIYTTPMNLIWILDDQYKETKPQISSIKCLQYISQYVLKNNSNIQTLKKMKMLQCIKLYRKYDLC